MSFSGLYPSMLFSTADNQKQDNLLLFLHGPYRPNILAVYFIEHLGKTCIYSRQTANNTLYSRNCADNRATRLSLNAKEE
jgi:hypothetical protein